MAEAKPVQPAAYRPAMHAHAVDRRHLGHDLVQRQIALGRQSCAQPVGVGRKLPLGMVALRLRRQAPRRALQDHHVVHETRRDPEVPRRLPVPVTFLDEGDDPAPQLDRMWLAHADPQNLARSQNHKPPTSGILNRMNRDTL